MTVEDVAAASQFIGLVLILRGEEVDHQNRITNAADGIDPGCQLETDVIGDKGAITLPSSIGLERKTNPFLRAGDPALQQALRAQGHRADDALSAFTSLRQAKDRF